MHIAVFGATGFASSAIVKELTDRGHPVTAVARRVTSAPQRPKVQVIKGSAHDIDVVTKGVAGADAVIVALPAIDDQGTTLDVHIATLLEAAKEAGARVGIVGGAGSLHAHDGGPRLEETPDFSDFLRPVAAAHRRALDVLAAADGAIDWFYLSPAVLFGAHVPGGAPAATESAG